MSEEQISEKGIERARRLAPIEKRIMDEIIGIQEEEMKASEIAQGREDETFFRWLSDHPENERSPED